MSENTIRLAAFFLVAITLGTVILTAPRICGASQDQVAAFPAELDSARLSSLNIDEWEAKFQRRSRIENFLPLNDSATAKLTLVSSSSGEPPQNPILRFEIGQHANSLRSFSVDAAGRFLVSGSDDKTVRVWAIPESRDERFELTRILRPPIGPGEEGKSYSVAISPDASTIAVSGWACFLWDGAYCIYLFDRESGAMIGRLTGMPHRIRTLAYSPDGRFLAAGLGGKDGIRVFRRSDWTPVSVERQTSYGGDVYGLSFARDGRLVTASYDGKVRLYSNDFQLIAIRTIFSSQERVSEAVFSPDGRYIAATSVESPKIAILVSADLAVLRRPKTFDITEKDADLSHIAWSFDGKYLFAGGGARPYFLNGSSPYIIRRYDTNDYADYIDIKATNSDAISEIATLPTGNVIFSTFASELGFVLRNGEVRSEFDWLINSNNGSPREKHSNANQIRLSRNGKVVSTSFSRRGLNHGAVQDRYFRFDIGQRQIMTSDQEAFELAPPRLYAPGLSVTGWISSREKLAVNGKRIRLLTRERSQALAISPGGDSFLLGADYVLRLFNRKGDVIWEHDQEAISWKVNITEDGQFAVVAYDDGTIRWHHMNDGKELLALFVTNAPDNPEWVAWTPAGYYDASPGAEDLIGWHVNQGADREALFFSASRFRDLYYRPDIIKAALNGIDPAPPPTREALLAAAPPIVTILGERALPGGDVAIDYEATTIFGEPVAIDLFVDNAKVGVEGARVATVTGERQSITVPRGSCATTIAVVARTADGRASDAALVSRASLRRITCEKGEPPKPDLHALLIGVSDYGDNRLDLAFADRDAKDFAALLKSQAGRAYENVYVTTITNSDATNGNTRKALAALEVAADEGDVSLLFFAGHGVKSERLNSFFFLAHDSDTNALRTTAVDSLTIKQTVQNILGRKFVFLDACFSAFASNDGLSLFDMHGISNILGGSDIRAEVFASSTGDQLSFENEDWENGAFTEAILEGLIGAADLIPDDEITNTELDLWVKTRVATLTDNRQTPSHTGAGSTQIKFTDVP